MVLLQFFVGLFQTVLGGAVYSLPLAVELLLVPLFIGKAPSHMSFWKVWAILAGIFCVSYALTLFSTLLFKSSDNIQQLITDGIALLLYGVISWEIFSSKDMKVFLYYLCAPFVNPLYIWMAIATLLVTAGIT